MAILLGSQAVDDFVERAVAATGDDELAAVARGLLRDFRSVARAGSFGEFGFDAVGGKDAAGLVEQASPAVTAESGVRVVDQQSVLVLRVHGLPSSGPNNHCI